MAGTSSAFARARSWSIGNSGQSIGAAGTAEGAGVAAVVVVDAAGGAAAGSSVCVGAGRLNSAALSSGGGAASGSTIGEDDPGVIAATGGSAALAVDTGAPVRVNPAGCDVAAWGGAIRLRSTYQAPATPPAATAKATPAHKTGRFEREGEAAPSVMASQ
jgi:hypothetical protein